MAEITSDYPGRQSAPEDHLLRRFIETLAQSWKVILALTLLTGAIAVAATLYAKDNYTAEVAVSLLDVRSEVIFDPNFKTVPSSSPIQRDNTNREQALRALATSKTLLIQVFNKVSPQLAEEDRDYTTFENAVSIENPGDLLILRVTWSDPRIAATIANQWANLFTTSANQSYVSSGSNTTESSQAGVADAFKNYEKVQGDLEAFIGNNDLDAVQRELAETDSLIGILQEQKLNVLRMENSTAILSASRLVSATQEMLLNEIDVSIRKKDQDRVRQLDDQYERKGVLERLERQLKDLETQLKDGTASSAAATGDALALIFTRSGLFGQGDTQDMILNIDLEQVRKSGADLSAADVTNMLQIVHDSITEINLEIERLTSDMFMGNGLDVPTTIPADHRLFKTIKAQTAAILGVDVALDTDSKELEEKPLSQALVKLSDRRQTLRSQVENLESKQRELVRSRDGAWELYTTLSNKSREAEAQFVTGAAQTRVAVEAFMPTSPDSRHLTLIALLAAILGMGMGLVYTVARTVLGRNDNVVQPMRTARLESGAGD